jgi:alkylated DNA repair protein (DNA oxidative demethylase)
MTLFSPFTDDRRRRTVAPGAVHLPGCLDRDQQRALVDAFHGWANGPVPIRATELPSGGRMSVKTVCLGWHWQPYKYTRTADDLNGREVLALPAWLADLGRGVLADAYDPESAQRWHPDAALVNYYDDTARLGMHRDKDEVVDEPVVSLSIGDSCRFRFGNTENRGKPYQDIELMSGDAFVFGRQSRFAYHGVPRTHPGTADPACGLATGRINITMRVTGLTDR